MTNHALKDRARALRPALRDRSDEIEAARRIPADLSEELGDAGLYRMLVPEALGGSEVPPTVFLEVLESLAQGDAAAAWVVMTSSTTGMLLAYLAPDAAREILDASPNAAFAGVFAPTGRAVPEGGGYRLSGRWRYGSGCENAVYRMGGALVFEGGTARRLERGGPEIRSCFFRADESTVHDTWKVQGLRGTGSHDLSVEEVLVEDRMTVCLLSDSPQYDGALYRFPVFGLLATGICAVGLGIAKRALAHVIELVKEKRSRGGKKSMGESELVQVEVAKARAQLLAARALLSDTLKTIYADASEGRSPTDAQRADLRMAATHASLTSSSVVDTLHRVAGGASIWDASPLSRAQRDIHVLTQHIMVATDTLKPVGRVLFGLPTDVSQL